MGSSFYARTIAAIRTQLTELFGKVEPIQAPQGSAVHHLIWMCEQIEQAPRDPLNAPRAARWIGWMCKQMEILGIWSNEASRQFIKLDVQDGNDMPDRGTVFVAIRNAFGADWPNRDLLTDAEFSAELDRMAHKAVNAVAPKLA